MPNQRACIPCKYPAAQTYLDRRLSEGADLPTIRHELDSPYRKKAIGYVKGPTLKSLQDHQKHHRGHVAPASSNLPSFASGESDGSEGSPTQTGDVATAIQQQALEMLEKGEMRLNAAQALKAQEMIDRRAERQKDRELTVLLARLMTGDKRPPAALIAGDDTIEGEAVEVEVGRAD